MTMLIPVPTINVLPAAPEKDLITLWAESKLRELEARDRHHAQQMITDQIEHALQATTPEALTLAAVLIREYHHALVTEDPTGDWDWMLTKADATERGAIMFEGLF